MSRSVVFQPSMQREGSQRSTQVTSEDCVKSEPMTASVPLSKNCQWSPKTPLTNGSHLIFQDFHGGLHQIRHMDADKLAHCFSSLS